MSNQAFLHTINKSFQKYLESGARSNEKLKILHGYIANELASRLGSDYEIASLGYGAGKEQNISGKYIDKNVDITINQGGKPIAGIAVKYVMSNYSQNSNNYFENMLGETANIRCTGVQYFQIIIMTQNAPYFEKGGRVSRIEKITANNLHKYSVLSGDDASLSQHSPDKTLLYLVQNTRPSDELVSRDKQAYYDYYLGNSELTTCSLPGVEFKSGVVFNDFDEYINKISHRIMSV